MDAIEFVKQLRRMDENASREYRVFFDSPEDVVAEVEQWSKEHPLKTWQSVFLERYPGAEIDEGGCLMLCPLTVSADRRNRHGDCTTLKCTDCRREFWMQEVE